MLSLGRITNEQKNLYKVLTEDGVLNSRLKGNFLLKAENLEDFPRVGDFVAIEKFDDMAIIHGILKRKNFLSKKISGSRFDEQILATNLDCIFLVMGLNNDYNLRRLERYVSLAIHANIKYAIILNKTDICDDYSSYVEECKKISLTNEVYPVSALTKHNLEIFDTLIKPQATYAFIGSSGAGKSTIINYLIGQNIQETMPLSVYEKGKHTTTSRELFLLPNGGIVIDTPGMKSIGLLDDNESIETSFNDIETLSKDCHFKNCTHKTEPGCKVLEAIKNNTLDEGRLYSYHKLKKEAIYMEQKEAFKLKQKNKRMKI